METTWVLVANSSHAKLFRSINIGRDISLEQTLDHPESRLKTQDLVSEGAGNFKARNQQGQGSFVSKTDHKEYEAILFAKEIAQLLEQGRHQHSYDRLVFVAPSKFQGLLNHECSSYVRDLVVSKLDRDYTALNDKDLVSHLDEIERF